ncbi:MAG TPA: Os1348 family NHLP clan protein [Dehalococcoidia bacterium]|nr:Os1348 family NHLP clan protein [Dehalococcoidia bacterium]
MSLNAVQGIISRAVTDTEFREALRTNPDAVLGERDVTPDEVTAIKAMDWSAVSSVGTDVELRVSRFGLVRAAGCK